MLAYGFVCYCSFPFDSGPHLGWLAWADGDIPIQQIPSKSNCVWSGYVVYLFQLDAQMMYICAFQTQWDSKYWILRMYAQRRKFPISQVWLTLEQWKHTELVIWSIIKTTLLKLFKNVSPCVCCCNVYAVLTCWELTRGTKKVLLPQILAIFISRGY